MKTHINDTTAYNLGYRYALLNGKNHCTAYFSDGNAAMKAAMKARGSRVVHLTGYKSADVTRLERNGYSTEIHHKNHLRRNPVKDFQFPENYYVPQSTIERVKESYAPGIRWVAGKPKFGVKEETVWPIPDVQIPVPKGLSYLPHQIAGISAMLHKKNVLLADEQGLGKTIEIAGYINATQPDRTLIVCPTIALYNWYEELKLWLVNKETVILFYIKEKFCTFKFEKVKGKTKMVFTPITNQDNPNWNIVITNYNSFKGRKSLAETAAEVGQIQIENKSEGKKGRPKKGEEKAKKVTQSLPLKVRKTLKKFERVGLDLLVLDEVHTLKNATAYWTMALLGEPEDPLSETPPYEGLASFAKRNIFASGTPIVNKDPKDMFPALTALDKDSFPHEKVFIDEFGGGRVKKRGKKGGYQATEDAKNEEILGIKLRDTVLIRRKADDVLELPELIRKNVEIEETDLVKRARALEMEALKVSSEEEIEWAIKERIEEDGTDEDDVADDVDSAEDDDAGKGEEYEDRVKKLTVGQIADLLADPYLSKEDRIRLNESLKALQEEEISRIAGQRASIDFEKIQLARVAMGIAKASQFKKIFNKIMAEIEPRRMVSDKIVIFYNFESSGDIIHAILTGQGEKGLGFKEDQVVRIDGQTKAEIRGDLVESFKKDPNVKIFLATISTCSTAITLTCSNVSIFMEMDWRPAYILQAEKRTHRYARENMAENVFCFYPFAPKSIDASVFNTLQIKQQIQGKILDTFPTQEKISEYEDKFKTPKLQGVKYSLTQRTLVRLMLDELMSHYQESKKKGKNYELLDRLGLSYNDIYILEDLSDEFKGNRWDSYRTYGDKKPERTLEFPEDMIDKALPIMWKMKTLVPKSMWDGGKNSVQFPTSITGLVRNLFNPLKSGTYDYEESPTMSENNYLHQLFYVATIPIRQQMYKELQAERAARRRAGESVEELQRLAEEGE
jgi:SNF2 family DNA or RNA helicase